MHNSFLFGTKSGCSLSPLAFWLYDFYNDILNADSVGCDCSEPEPSAILSRFMCQVSLTCVGHTAFSRSGQFCYIVSMLGFFASLSLTILRPFLNSEAFFNHNLQVAAFPATNTIIIEFVFLQIRIKLQKGCCVS